MPFNDDQLFYAALYWTEALPGGADFGYAICEDYNKSYFPTQAPQQTKEKIHNDERVEYADKESALEKTLVGVTEKECKTFFDTLYTALKAGEEKARYTMSGKDGMYLELRRDFASVNSDPFYFSDTIELALTAAGLQRDILPDAPVFLHDNGQFFAYSFEQSKIVEVIYPGRPEIGYKSLPNFTYQDMADAPMMETELLYRIVPLEPGQTYKQCYIAVSGQKCFFENYVAQEGDVLVLEEASVALDTLTDKEIIECGDKIINCSIDRAEEYTPGYGGKDSGHTVGATDDPRIIRYVIKARPCLDVTEKTQIYSGSSFQLAEPGDKLIVEGPGYQPRVLHAADITRGKLRLIPVQKSVKPSARRAPKPH